LQAESLAQPFTCPFCGAHDYTIVLHNADVAGATLREEFFWDAEAGEYSSDGTVVVDSQSVESERAQASCTHCEKDVSEAVSAYEDSLSGEAEG